MKVLITDVSQGNVNLSKDLLNGEGRMVFPVDFDVNSWISYFSTSRNEKNYSLTKSMNSNLNSQNFLQPSEIPDLGKTYGVGMRFLLDVGVGVNGQEILDCMKLIPDTHSFGGHALSLFHIQRPDLFKKGNNVLSFDKRDSLWMDPGGNHRLLCVERTLGGSWKFDLTSFDSLYEHGDIIFYVYEI